MSPSSRLEARNQARAIPLVTVSLARGHLRQTRLASSTTISNDNNQSATEQDLDQDHDRHQNHNNSNNGDHPPSYDSITTSSSASSRTTGAESLQESRLAAPSNAALTEAVLHLSRTLVTPVPPSPRPQPSWLFMMIYSWTHTQKTATRLYHILTKPSTLLHHIQGQNDQVHHKKQRKSIQQITDEQDRMEDDPDMRFGAATEMVPVSMMNTRSTASMADEALPLSSQDPMQLSSSSLLGDDFTDDSALPRKPKRRIESYSNPFAPPVNDMEPQEDDEGWLGMGEECSVDGVTKTNSVRLTSPTFPQAFRGRIPEFTTSSLGPAMDPHQFESESSPRSDALPIPSFSTNSIFNRSTGVTFDRPSSRASINSQSTVSNYVTPPSSMVSPAPSANSNRTLVTSQTPRQDKIPSHWQQQGISTTTEPQEEEEEEEEEGNEHLVSAASSIYHDLPSDEDHSSVWSDQSSSYREHHQAATIQFPTIVRSSTAFADASSSIVISSASPPTLIPPALPILSSSASIHSFETPISIS
ncbi:MAG: hypothetical protein JOS17DRAFT_778310 [Linnemannia elongata]|nr:MAG: hypothetical protein JOS17DRAFT_778310 [Linnemannia elongata]